MDEGKGGNTPQARAIIERMARAEIEEKRLAAEALAAARQREEENDKEQDAELARKPKARDTNALSGEYPVDDCLWQGVFAEIADRIGERSWPVWLGTYAALMARINRGLQVDYWGSLICGQPYALMIGYSGSNKSLAARICRELIPESYQVRKAVSSGPGLLEILRATTDSGEEEDKAPVNPIPSQPAILVIEEWTGLLKYAGLSGSVLFEDICDMYHTRYNFNVTTKKRSGGEGGDQNLERPTLSILGTTTPGGFSKAVTKSMIEYGFINRHLILPCKSDKPQTALRTEEERAAKKGRGLLFPALLSDCLDLPFSWAQGEDLEGLLSPEVRETMGMWIEQTVTSQKNLYQDGEPPLIHQACIPRLDRHFIQICFAYAAATQSEEITLEHVEAAVWVVTTAQRFTEALVQDRPITATFLTQEHMDLDERILAKVGEYPGKTKKELCLMLRRHASYPEIGKRIDLLVGSGMLRREKIEDSRREGLWPA